MREEHLPFAGFNLFRARAGSGPSPYMWANSRSNSPICNQRSASVRLNFRRCRWKSRAYSKLVSFLWGRELAIDRTKQLQLRAPLTAPSGQFGFSKKQMSQHTPGFLSSVLRTEDLNLAESLGWDTSFWPTPLRTVVCASKSAPLPPLRDHIWVITRSYFSPSISFLAEA